VPEKPSAEFTRTLESARRLAWTPQAEVARAEVIYIVNLLHSNSTSHAAIRVYIDRLQHS
jgi:hypothetical protein